MSYQSTENSFEISSFQLYKAHRGYVLSLFIFVSRLTVFVSGICILSLMMLMTISLSSKLLSSSIHGLIHLIIELYEVFLCIIIILVEMEYAHVMRSILIFQSWALRGICYIFVGLIICEDFISFIPSSASIEYYRYLIIPSAVLVSLGIIYLLMVSQSLCLILVVYPVI